MTRLLSSNFGLLRDLCNLLTAFRYNRPDSPTLTWSSLQHLLENAIPYVLIILDCCYAANAARDTAEGTTKELLAACGRENPTLGVGFRSFTSALIEELQAFGPAPFTTAMLHSRLVTMRWRLAFTPIYALLSEHGGHSIELAPLPVPPSPEIGPEPGQPQSVPGSFDDFLAPIHQPATLESAYSPSSQRSLSRTAADTRVLLAVSIAGDAIFDVSQWRQWLISQAPWDVTKVEVKAEGVFQSHSTMLLTSIPVSVWDKLPNRSAYRFIGFVISENRLDAGSSTIPQEQSADVAGLPSTEPRKPRPILYHPTHFLSNLATSEKALHQPFGTWTQLSMMRQDPPTPETTPLAPLDRTPSPTNSFPSLLGFSAQSSGDMDWI